MWNVKWECGVWSVECGVWSVECGVRSGVMSVKCEVWSLETGVECSVHTVHETTEPDNIFGFVLQYVVQRLFQLDYPKMYLDSYESFVQHFWGTWGQPRPDVHNLWATYGRPMGDLWAILLGNL